MKGRVLVGDIMCKFGLNHMTSIECPLCSKAAETIDHVFLNCVWSSEVWKRCMGWWGVHSCSNLGFVDWWKGWSALCPSLDRKRAWNVLFFAVIWTIWESRNGVVFRSSQACIGLALDTIKFRVALWFKNHGQGSNCDLTLLMLDIRERCVDSVPTKVQKSVVWVPPMGDELSFNVDGSARGNPRDAGIGGVLRDSSGKVLCLFSLYVGVVDSNSAEVLAIHRACQLISSNVRLASRNIALISDSKTAVSWIKSKDFGNFKLVNLIYDIRSFLHNSIGKSIFFKPRGSNSFADSLAKGGSSRSGDRLEWSDF
jgi:hypothetical protein